MANEIKQLETLDIKNINGCREIILNGEKLDLTNIVKMNICIEPGRCEVSMHKCERLKF